MRVVVCPDRIGDLPSAEVGAALARAFVGVRPRTEVAVVPLARSGADLAGALADLGRPAPVLGAAADGGADAGGSSLGLGRRLAEVLQGRPARVVLDLVGSAVEDAGAGLLHALGAVGDAPLDAGPDALASLTRLDLSPARELVGATELVAVVETAAVQDVLLGLRGLSARRSFARGDDPARLLARDASIGRLAAALGVADAPGLGAGGGVPLALAPFGGWVTSGPSLCAGVAGLDATASRADVVLTACDALGFVDRGGDVVAEACAVAERAMRPCVVVARRVEVSARELRSFGVEAAHALGEDAGRSAADLTRLAEGVARSWTW